MFHTILFWICIVLIVINVIMAIDALRRRMLPTLTACTVTLAALSVMAFMDSGWFKISLLTISIVAAHFLWKHARWAEAQKSNH